MMTIYHYDVYNTNDQHSFDHKSAVTMDCIEEIAIIDRHAEEIATKHPEYGYISSSFTLYKIRIQFESGRVAEYWTKGAEELLKAFGLLD